MAGQTQFEDQRVEDTGAGGNVHSLPPKPADRVPSEACAKELETVLYSVKRLARYAVETGQLPDEVNIADLHTILTAWYQKHEITPDGLNRIAHYYQVLERELGPITARTLEATDTHGGTHYRKTTAGRHAIHLWVITGLVVVSILLVEWYEKSYSGVAPDLKNFIDVLVRFIAPFIYGSLGSCVYLLRVTETRLRHRDFDSTRIPEHWNRLVLGTLCGGAIILVLEQTIESVSTVNGVPVTAALVGFLAGYSVDFLFDIVDRLIEGITSKLSPAAADPKKLKKTQDAVLSRQTEILAKFDKLAAKPEQS